MTTGVSLLRSIPEAIKRTDENFDKWCYFYLAIDVLLKREDDSNPLVKISIILNNMCYICSSIDREFYWIKRTFHTPDHLENYACIVYTLTKAPAEKKYVEIEGKSRPVFRFGIPCRGGVKWASVKEKNKQGETVALPVFIQSHALERSYERLKPLAKAKIQVLLYETFKDPELSIGPDNTRLISFRYNKTKIGYLVYDIVFGMVVIKTFLLITQNGTYEGNKLNQNYNLSKFTKTYFELDKLYTFINTDVYEDESLRALFSECGCGSLFTVWDNRKNEKDAITFDKNYAKNLKKIFLQ